MQSVHGPVPEAAAELDFVKTVPSAWRSIQVEQMQPGCSEIASL